MFNLCFADIINTQAIERNFDDPDDELRKCLEEGIFTLQEFIAIPHQLNVETQRSLTTREARNATKVRREQDPDLSLYETITDRNREKINAFNKPQSTHTTSINNPIIEKDLARPSLAGTSSTRVEVIKVEELKGKSKDIGL